MPKVLTESSTISCGHGGKASPSGSSKLTVSGAKVILFASIAGASFDGNCSVKDDTSKSLLQCKHVAGTTAGGATKLTVGGAPVALDTLAGTTDGAPANTLLSAQAGGDKLQAV